VILVIDSFVLKVLIVFVSREEKRAQTLQCVSNNLEPSVLRVQRRHNTAPQREIFARSVNV